MAHVWLLAGLLHHTPMGLKDRLGDEHGLVERALRSIVSGPSTDEAVRQTFEQCVRALRKHMYVEEEIIFPRVLAHFGGEVLGVVRGLEAEHGAVLKLLEKARLALQMGDQASFRRELEGVLRVLHGGRGQLGHHQREEQTVYSLLDVLGEKPLEELEREAEVAAAPEDWTSRSLRG